MLVDSFSMSREVYDSEFALWASSSEQNPSGRFQDAIENNRNSIFAELIAAEKLKNYKECLELSSKALCILPNSNEFMVLKANFLVLTNRFHAAIETLREIFKENSQNAEAISVLGLVFYHQGNLKRSVEVFDSALQLNSGMDDIKGVKENARNFIEVLKKSEFHCVDL